MDTRMNADLADGRGFFIFSIMLCKDVTDIVIASFYEVYNTLGYGFLERVYQNALYKELRRKGLKCEAQKEIKVFYKGEVVGNYYADLLIEDKIILELKILEQITTANEAQLLNYLRATEVEIGFILNFGSKATFKRLVFSNYAKNKHLRKDRFIENDDESEK